MTPNEVKAHFEFLVDDDNVSDANALVMMNVAKDKLFARREWQFLKAMDDSNTTSGSTNETFAFPTRFSQMVTMWIGETEIVGIRPEQRRLFRNSFKRYYLDIPNQTVQLTYTSESGQVVYMDYLLETADLELDDTDISTTILGFKKSFHAVLAYEMAKVFFYQDTGDKGDSWHLQHQAEYQDLFNLMKRHDEALKISAQHSAIPYAGYPTDQENVLNDPTM